MRHNSNTNRRSASHRVQLSSPQPTHLTGYPPAPAPAPPAPAPHITAQPLVPLGNGWTLAAFVLIRESRKCECGVTHTCTAPYPSIQMVDRRGATRTLNMQDMGDYLHILTSRMQEEFRWPHLPRRILDVRVDVAACEACYTTFEEEDGVDLFGAFTQYPLSLDDLHRLIVYGEDLRPTAEELRDARDARNTSGTRATVATEVVPLDLAAMVKEMEG